MRLRDFCVIAVFAFIGPSAAAMPSISITAPPPGQPVTILQPTITVQYVTDGAALNLASLQVSVNGRDFSAKFQAVATESSASYTLSEAEALVPGNLTIDAAIADTAGGTASTSQPYDVLPTLVSLSPTSAAPGDILVAQVDGLDPSGTNALVFASLRDPAGIEAALANIDATARTGTVVVPEGVAVGSVVARVNGKTSVGGAFFKPRGPYVDCGIADRLAALPDGSMLVSEWPYLPSLDPRCPPVPTFSCGIGFGCTRRGVVVREFPDGMVELSDRSGDNDSSPTNVDVVIDKAGKDFAIVKTSTMFRPQGLLVTYRNSNCLPLSDLLTDVF